MLDINKLLECAGNNIAETLKMVDPAQIDAIAEAIANAHKSGHNIFTAGWGRAGNIIRILGRANGGDDNDKESPLRAWARQRAELNAN